MKELPGRLLLTVVAVVIVAACATLQQGRWEAATAADTITAYENFLQEHPEGAFADRARVRRSELQEERDWKDAEAKNTVQAYEDFRVTYPRGRYKNDVYARLQMLAPPKAADLPSVSTEKLRKRYQRGVFLEEALATGEKLAFDQAVTGNTIGAYEDFLRRYPAGRRADDARRRWENLSFERARAASDGYVNRQPEGTSAGETRLRREKRDAASPVPEWGTIMYPKPKTSIRAKRSAASRLKGQLKTGQPVKADFLRDSWYAVFPVTQKERNEGMALGYVHAPLLIEKRGSDPLKSPVTAAKSSQEAPPNGREAERLPVEVRGIVFKVAGDGKELLLIEFDRFCPPGISGIEGNEPRIILEIQNAAPLRDDWTVIDTDGHFVRRIRASRDAQTRTALIVLEMVPEKAYFVNPAFYQKEHIYSLEISEGTEPGLP